MSAPNGATTQYVYDDLANLVGYTYDALNRITGIDYPSDTDTVFTYDAGDPCTTRYGCEVSDRWYRLPTPTTASCATTATASGVSRALRDGKWRVGADCRWCVRARFLRC